MAARILIVEDDTYIRDLYRDLLKREGYEVTTAANGDEGLVEALKGGFDLILLDVLMPKKDGVSFLKEYKTVKPQRPNGQIVILTALAQDPIIKGCFELGASGYLIKPQLTPDQVIAEVKGFLASPQK